MFMESFSLAEIDKSREAELFIGQQLWINQRIWLSATSKIVEISWIESRI